MSLVLCATRGGEASIPTQEKAIELAIEKGLSLAFLYVADSSFLNKTANSNTCFSALPSSERAGSGT